MFRKSVGDVPGVLVCPEDCCTRLMWSRVPTVRALTKCANKLALFFLCMYTGRVVRLFGSTCVIKGSSDRTGLQSAKSITVQSKDACHCWLSSVIYESSCALPKLRLSPRLHQSFAVEMLGLFYLQGSETVPLPPDGNLPHKRTVADSWTSYAVWDKNGADDCAIVGPVFLISRPQTQKNTGASAVKCGPHTSTLCWYGYACRTRRNGSRKCMGFARRKNCALLKFYEPPKVLHHVWALRVYLVIVFGASWTSLAAQNLCTVMPPCKLSWSFVHTRKICCLHQQRHLSAVFHLLSVHSEQRAVEFVVPLGTFRHRDARSPLRAPSSPPVFFPAYLRDLIGTVVFATARYCILLSVHACCCTCQWKQIALLRFEESLLPL